jgi:chromosome partitioning protein
MIVVVGGIKGGSGKSTIAVNLAVARATKHKVLLVDGDDQQSTTAWFSQRQVTHPDLSPNLAFAQVGGKTARERVLKVSSQYDAIIIDVGGRDTTTQRAALSVADLFLIPLQPRSVDLWTLQKVSELILEIKTINPNLKCGGFINRAFASGTDNETSMEAIGETENIDLIDLKIGDRKSFSNSFGGGLAVPENRPPDRKAIEELQALYMYCFHSKLV